MFDSAHDAPSHLRPLNLSIQLFIDQSADNHVLPSNQVQAMAVLGARFRVVWWSYNTLDGLAEDKVRRLVAGEESAD